MTTTIIQGHWLDRLREQPERRFRTCVTSPPYLWQRHYLDDDHPDTAIEVGRESTIADYIAALVGGLREVRRVLTDDGTLWINIGDGYANDGKWGGRTGGKHRASLHGKTGIGRDKHTTGIAPKCLMGIPWRVAFALVDDGWTLRSEIIWEKPNAMPSSVEDRPTTAHEHVFLFSKSPRYFFDMAAVREPYATPERVGRPVSASAFRGQRAIKPGGRVSAHDYDRGGRNMRSVWSIATESSGTEHAAPMPRALARRCLLAGSAVGDHVLDPFGGSGTLGLVAEQDGRHATLIDLDARACAAARERCAQIGLFGAPVTTAAGSATP